MTLLLALSTMLALGTMILALLTSAVTEPRIANNLLQGSQTFYVAESGLEMALARLNRGEHPEGTWPVGAGTVTVTVSNGLLWWLLDPQHVQIQAQGEVQGAPRRVSNRFERGEDGRWRPLGEFREEPE